MKILEQLRSLIEEPPPAFAFELSSQGIAHWQNGQVQFDAYPGSFDSQDALALTELIGQLTPPPSGSRRRPAAVILPDSAARVMLMDFDQFHRKDEDQLSLIRFRLKRTVPFDVDTAILRYIVYPRGGSRVDLLVAAIAIETLAPYETAFRNAGFHPGYVTIAGLSAANLASPDTLTLRLSGSTLTLSHFSGEELRLFRCLDLQSDTLDEILNVLDPTLAWLEDERKAKPTRVDLCGLGALASSLTSHLQENWSLPSQPLRSRLGAVDAHQAGLYGYLEAMGVQ